MAGHDHHDPGAHGHPHPGGHDRSPRPRRPRSCGRATGTAMVTGTVTAAWARPRPGELRARLRDRHRAQHRLRRRRGRLWMGSANSMSLVADAGHNLSDVLGLLAAWVASVLVRRRATRALHLRPARLLDPGRPVQRGVPARRHGRDPLGGWSCAWSIRSRWPATTVMVVAGLGILVNGVTAWLFASGAKGDINIRGAFLHMAADAAVSAGVVLAGLVILAHRARLDRSRRQPRRRRADRLGDLGPAARQRGDVARRRAAGHRSRARCGPILRARPGVAALHDLHIWPMSTTETALTAHLVMAEGHPARQRLPDRGRRDPARALRHRATPRCRSRRPAGPPCLDGARTARHRRPRLRRRPSDRPFALAADPRPLARRAPDRRQLRAPGRGARGVPRRSFAACRNPASRVATSRSPTRRRPSRWRQPDAAGAGDRRGQHPGGRCPTGGSAATTPTRRASAPISTRAWRSGWPDARAAPPWCSGPAGRRAPSWSAWPSAASPGSWSPTAPRPGPRPWPRWRRASRAALAWDAIRRLHCRRPGSSSTPPSLGMARPAAPRPRPRAPAARARGGRHRLRAAGDAAPRRRAAAGPRGRGRARHAAAPGGPGLRGLVRPAPDRHPGARATAIVADLAR